MTLKMFKGLMVVAAILVMPVIGHAQQEATILGVVTDATGAVLPGVTITVTHVASGNTVTGVTDVRGEYRIPVRTGANKVTADLSGFNSSSKEMELLVGQQAVVNLQMATAGISENVTVTGASPLIDTTQSKVGGNIDPRQLQDLPVQGRNFLDLTLLAPGSRANATGDTPGVAFGQFQLNVDGQQITQNCCSGAGGQPKFAQDAIAEFQYVSQFDATQGRSAGVQVNVISKSGTNVANGAFAGYFRDSKMIAKDFITGTVLPYSNQQVNGTYGGPIVRDKAHYFLSYEFEREPSTAVYNATGNAAYFNANLTGVRKEKKGDFRLDFQLPAQYHLMLRGNNWHNELPLDPAFGGPGSTVSPSALTKTDRYSNQWNISLLKVIGNKAVNELKAGYSGQHWYSRSALADWVGGPNTFPGQFGGLPGGGTPLIQFSGYSIGTPGNIPQRIGQDVSTVRDDFSFSTQALGRQDFKVGGEFQNYAVWHDWCNNLHGTYSFIPQGSSRAVPADIATFFPDPMNPATWDIVGLAAKYPANQYTGEIGSCRMFSPRKIGASWLQDDWQMSEHLTVNLGLRWDGETNTFANEIAIPPFLAANRKQPLWNWGPRIGGAYKLNDKTVLRAGWGIYYSETINQTAHNTRIDNQQLSVIVPNPTNILNPYLSPGSFGTANPTFDQALATFCSIQDKTSDCVLRSFASSMVSPYQKIPHSFQTSVGVQRQFGQTISAEAAWVWTALRGDRVTNGNNANSNLIFDPNTGANVPFSAAVTAAGAATRAYPEFGLVRIDDPNGKSDYKALQTQFTKRFSQRWQASATYTLAYNNDAQMQGQTGPNEVPFKLAPDFAYEYGPAVGDQRHRATFTGIYQIGWGFQASGVYFYGSGQLFAVNCGSDFRSIGLAGGTRFCSPAAAAAAVALTAAQTAFGVTPPQFVPGTTVLVRNQLAGRPIHRVDARLVKQFKLPGKMTADGRLELFNLFNHANYGSYGVNVANASYGLPSSTSVAQAGTVYNPRTLQLGFRVTF